MSGATGPETVMVTAQELTSAVSKVFTCLGFGAPAAAAVAASLVESDQRGVHSHGVRLMPTYVTRMLAGTISRYESAAVALDLGAVAVLDAQHMLGQLAADQAMALAVDKAQVLGAGVVVVRQACHFGAAARYVLAAAEHGCIGVAAATTSALMAGWGGAEAVVGNNPFAVGAPSADGIPFVLDMALSEGALGKIQLAVAHGVPIPAGWATRSDGVPTTDPVEALAGLLLPTGGPKGLGLAMAVDVLAGVLSGGGWGSRVRPLFTETESPNDCSHFFLALDVASFRDLDGFRDEVAGMARGIRGSRRAPGVERLYAPGEPEWVRGRANRSAAFALDASIVRSLVEAGRAAGAELDLRTT